MLTFRDCSQEYPGFCFELTEGPIKLTFEFHSPELDDQNFNDLANGVIEPAFKRYEKLGTRTYGFSEDEFESTIELSQTLQADGTFLPVVAFKTGGPSSGSTVELPFENCRKAFQAAAAWVTGLTAKPTVQVISDNVVMTVETDAHQVERDSPWRHRIAISWGVDQNTNERHWPELELSDNASYIASTVAKDRSDEIKKLLAGQPFKLTLTSCDLGDVTIERTYAQVFIRAGMRIEDEQAVKPETFSFAAKYAEAALQTLAAQFRVEPR